MLAARDQSLDSVIEFDMDDDLFIRLETGTVYHRPSGRSYHEEFYPPKQAMTDDVSSTFFFGKVLVAEVKTAKQDNGLFLLLGFYMLFYYDY